MRTKNKTIFASAITIAAFVSIFLTRTVFAGGGLVSFTVSPTAILNPGEQYIVRPTVYIDNELTQPAVNYPIQIALENPQSNDYISQSSNVTDANGEVYAKVISYIPGIRLAYALVTLPDGTIYKSSDVVLNYSGESTPTPYPTLSPTPIPLSTPTVIGVTTLPSSVPLPTPHISGVITTDPNTSPIPTIYVSTPGITPTITHPMDTPYIAPTTVVTPSSTPNADKTIADLNKKVDSLQQQVNQTQQKESVLEQIVTHMQSFLKSLFPFFN